MSNTDTAPAETYAEKVDLIAAELLDVLRDVLGPERRLPEPRAAYAHYGDHSVTVSDGENGRVPPHSRRPLRAPLARGRPGPRGLL